MEHRHVLARSRNYEVSHDFEMVYLSRFASSRLALFASPKPEVVIGDFYGDPRAAVIDEKERFVIMVGYGLILYNLTKPFQPYSYDVQTNQWMEMFRDKNEWWIESISQQNENTFQFTVDPHSDKSGTYQITFPDLAIQRAR